MGKHLLILLILVSTSLKAQQWEWAVTADSVYGNQQTIMICQSNNNLYALIYQYGPSIINNTYLDSGSVIVKINTSGQILWAKHFPGTIQSLYAENNGNIYFIGVFSDTLNFSGSPLISHGGKDVFYGELDPAGNKLWVNSAGGLQDDLGNAIISDGQNNIFVAGQIKDDYYVGSQALTGNSGYTTYLFRCNLSGNYVEAHGDSTTNIGLTFQKDPSGTIYLSAFNNYYPCPYACSSINILKINPQDFTLNIVAHFGSFEYLHSWTVNSDSSITANYNTESHYGVGYSLFNISTTNMHTFRKGLGDGYDGKSTPFITKGTGTEIIVGGSFYNSYNYWNYDTLWYDNFVVLPDSLPNIMIGGINTSNQFTWLLRSEGKGSNMSSLISDEQGHCYTGGNYNIHGYYLQNSLPNPVTFGNIVLSAENNKTRFFVAGVRIDTVTNVSNAPAFSHLSVFPNPANDKLYVNFPQQLNTGTIKVFNAIGSLIIENKITSSAGSYTVDISRLKSGIYSVEVLVKDKIYTEKFVIAR